MSNLGACFLQILAFIKRNEVVLFGTLLGTVVLLLYMQIMEETTSSGSRTSAAQHILSTPGRVLSSLKSVVRVDSYFKQRNEQSHVNQQYRNVAQTNKNSSFFLRAVRKNDVNLLRTLSPLLDRSSFNMELALRQAVLSDSVDALMFLCNEMGANVNAENDYALRWAVRKGNTKMTDFLMHHGANMSAAKHAILQDAILHGYVEIANILQQHLPAEMFLEHNFPRDQLPSVYERVLSAVQEQHVETLHTLFRGGCRLDFCAHAAWRMAAELDGAIDLIVFFHRIARFDLDLCDGILLMNAVRRSDKNMVEYCVSHGADTHVNNDAAMEIADRDIAGLLGGRPGPDDTDDTILSVSFDLNEIESMSSPFVEHEVDVSSFVPLNLSKELLVSNYREKNQNHGSLTPPPKKRRGSLFPSPAFDSPAGKKELEYGVLTRSRRRQLVDNGVLRNDTLPDGRLFR